MNALSPEFPASTPPLLSLREEDFCRWIGEADPGDRIEYHRGLLTADRIRASSLLTNTDRRELGAIADRARALARQGQLLLVQIRHGPADFSYLALMPKRLPQRSGGRTPRPEQSDPRLPRPAEAVNTPLAVIALTSRKPSPVTCQPIPSQKEHAR